MEEADFAAVVLAGGRGSRLGGVDKGALEIDGSSLLERALAAVATAVDTVVVGDPRPTSRPVRFCREEPAYAGPAAALLAGLDALLTPAPLVVVLAVDMPWVSPTTVRRLLAAAAGHDGAQLLDPTGRAQLALAVDPARLSAVRPPPGDVPGLALRRLLAPLTLVAVPTEGLEHRDIDTPDDLES